MWWRFTCAKRLKVASEETTFIEKRYGNGLLLRRHGPAANSDCLTLLWGAVGVFFVLDFQAGYLTYVPFAFFVPVISSVSCMCLFHFLGFLVSV